MLVVMCGRSFSGKSTLARVLARALKAELVSLDVINEERGLRGGEGIPVSEWVRTNEEASARTAVFLRTGRSVVVDDTSSPRFLRERWRNLADAEGARFVLVFVNATDEMIRTRLAANRQVSDRHDVADQVMEEHLDGFEPPAADEAPIVVDAELDTEAMAAQVLKLISAQSRTA
jgi:predicted kinase